MYCCLYQLSDSARARRAHKHDLLKTIGEQAQYERARKEAEKAYAREGVSTRMPDVPGVNVFWDYYLDWLIQYA